MQIRVGDFVLVHEKPQNIYIWIPASLPAVTWALCHVRLLSGKFHIWGSMSKCLNPIELDQLHVAECTTIDVKQFDSDTGCISHMILHHFHGAQTDFLMGCWLPESTVPVFFNFAVFQGKIIFLFLD